MAPSPQSSGQPQQHAGVTPRPPNAGSAAEDDAGVACRAGRAAGGAAMQAEWEGKEGSEGGKPTAQKNCSLPGPPPPMPRKARTRQSFIPLAGCARRLISNSPGCRVSWKNFRPDFGNFMRSSSKKLKKSARHVPSVPGPTRVPTPESLPGSRATCVCRGGLLAAAFLLTIALTLAQELELGTLACLDVDGVDAGRRCPRARHFLYRPPLKIKSRSRLHW